MTLSRNLLLAVGLLWVARLDAADCNENGVDDFLDLTSGTSLDCNQNGFPDECEVRPVNYSVGLTVEYPVPWGGGGPVIVTDFDGDGDADVGLSVAPRFYLSLNDGNGTLTPPGTIEFTGEQFLLAADIGEDAFPDLVSTNGAGLVFVRMFVRFPFRGTFSLLIDLGVDANAAAAADLDGDGDVDLAITAPFSLLPLWNDGNVPVLAFAVGEALEIGSNPVSVVAVDVDGDGDEDLVTANSVKDDLPGNVAVFANSGGGSLDHVGNFAVGPGPSSLAATDLDGDGDADLAVANRFGDDVSLLANRGDGTFAGAVSLATPAEPCSLATADLDADGDMDLVVTHATDSGGISVLLNHGNGSFASPLFHDRHGPVGHVATGDLDADGFDEIVVSEASRSAVRIYSRQLTAYQPDCNNDQIPDECQLADNDCNGNAVPDDCDLALGTSADCNANLVPDECEPDCNQNGVTDICDLSEGTSPDCNSNGVPDECDVAPSFVFGEEIVINDSTAFAVAAGDLDGDGDIDLVQGRADWVDIALNQGGATFEWTNRWIGGGGGLRSLSLADLDGDGDLDLAAGGSSIKLVWNDGNGVFTEWSHLQNLRSVESIAVADIDGDGDLDVAAAGLGTTIVDAWPNLGGGRFESFPTLGAQVDRPSGIQVADLDGDREFELLMIERASGDIIVLRSDSNAPGGFSAPDRLTLGDGALRLQTVDVENDGDPDLVAIEATSQNLGIFVNNGDGTFGGPRLLACCGVVGPLEAGDLDLDGDLDMVVVGEEEERQGVFFLRNRGDGSFHPEQEVVFKGQQFASGILLEDLDGDGMDDLVLLQVSLDRRNEVTHSRTFLYPNTTFPASGQDRNLNGVPDDCETLFHRGDPDANGELNLADGVFVLDYLFRDGAAPTCLEAADVDNDGRILLSDGVSVFRYLFAGGPAPPAPGPPEESCSVDTDPAGSANDLGCKQYQGC